MKSNKWKSYVFWILLSEAVGIIAGLLTSGGVEAYGMSVVKPALTPPAIVFPIVWTILYALMGIGAACVQLSGNSPEQRRGISLFILQLILNFFWPLFFFNLQAYGFSFVWLLALWAAVFLMILTFYKVDKLAAWLQIPYLIWLTFAAYLNLGVWLLNR
ncbi:MAG: tryptophan-rich sensory protein [Oscillospiraceae bacterium]|nr:tryptophan-rich sensory protein [Oscillospiraceae bacterium]